MPAIYTSKEAINQINDKIGLITATDTPRKLVKRGGKRVRGYAPSFKTPQMKPIEFESLHEEACIRALTVSNLVTEIQGHPRVLLLNDGKDFKYTPDFLVKLNIKPWVMLIEAKGDVFLTDKESAHRLLSISTCLNQLRVPFGVITSSDITEATKTAVNVALRELPVFIGTGGDIASKRTAWLSNSAAWAQGAMQADSLLIKVLGRPVADLVRAFQPGALQ